MVNILQIKIQYRIALKIVFFFKFGQNFVHSMKVPEEQAQSIHSFMSDPIDEYIFVEPVKQRVCQYLIKVCLEIGITLTSNHREHCANNKFNKIIIPKVDYQKCHPVNQFCPNCLMPISVCFFLPFQMKYKCGLLGASNYQFVCCVSYYHICIKNEAIFKINCQIIIDKHTNKFSFNHLFDSIVFSTFQMNIQQQKRFDSSR